MYVSELGSQSKSIGVVLVSIFITSRLCEYEKPEKTQTLVYRARPTSLLLRHSPVTSETIALLCHVIVAIVEGHLLPQN